MDTSVELAKLANNLNKKLRKYTKMDYMDYVNLFKGIGFVFNRVDNRDKLILVPDFNFKFEKRIDFVLALKQINYHRNKDKWTGVTAIAFMTEVMNYYMKDSEFYKDYIGSSCKILCPLEEIEERYNVPQNRFKTQVALFLINLDKGNDKFNILNYFTQIDLLLWKYRDNDIERIQKDIEKQILTEDILNLTKKLFNLEG